MGCCVPKDQPPATETHTTQPSSSPEEENAIRLQEDSLQYSSHKASHLCQELDKITLQSKVTPSSFFTFAAQNHLNTSQIDEEKSPIKNFYRKFRDGNRFDAVKLKTLAVLLGQGDPGVKAGLLFDTFRRGETMELEEIQAMIETILAISVDYLPLLAVKTEGLTEKSYIELTLSLGTQKDAVRDRMCNLILELQTVVTREHLVTRFSQDEMLQRLCSPHKVRKMLENEAVSLYHSLPQ